jgi:hypothetical protein
MSFLPKKMLHHTPHRNLVLQGSWATLKPAWSTDVGPDPRWTPLDYDHSDFALLSKLGRGDSGLLRKRKREWVHEQASEPSRARAGPA